jgi:hypothetical protein
MFAQVEDPEMLSTSFALVVGAALCLSLAGCQQPVWMRYGAAAAATELDRLIASSEWEGTSS